MSGHYQPEGFAAQRRVAELRESVLGAADLGAASSLAERITNEINDTLNAAGIDMATSLAARALLARGLLTIAADWFAMLPTAPESDTCLAALKSIVEELPPCLVGESYLDPALVQ